MQLGVDTQRGKTELQVVFDIAFPALPCCGTPERVQLPRQALQAPDAALAQLFSWTRWTLPVPMSGTQAQASHECACGVCAARGVC